MPRKRDRILVLSIRDRGTPDSVDKFVDLVWDIKTRLDAGMGVAIHCHAGIGRSRLIAAAVLILLDENVDDAFSAISHARGFSVPDTGQQKEWLHENADTLRARTNRGADGRAECETSGEYVERLQ